MKKVQLVLHMMTRDNTVFGLVTTFLLK
uniref:Uncharacterized protein n=1 Tax=Anguilla anguilla TaxID=7936 RepID=A0A0E9PTC4_ANGAN